MANEDEESFVPAYKKYAEMQDAILAGIDKVHARLKRLNLEVGAEWVQPGKGKRGGPSKVKRLYDYLKGKMPGYGGMKTHFEPEYSEAEKKERAELKGALEGFEKYNPKESKGPGFLKRMGPYAEKVFGKKSGGGKLSDYGELPGVSEEFLKEYDAKKAKEKEEFGKAPLEELEEYNPKDSKEYGITDRVKGVGAAIAKAKLPGYGKTEDKLENYVELVDEAEGPAAASGKGPKLRKSYGLEAHKDKLLGRRKISEMDQYAPEHSGR